MRALEEPCWKRCRTAPATSTSSTAHCEKGDDSWLIANTIIVVSMDEGKSLVRRAQARGKMQHFDGESIRNVQIACPELIEGVQSPSLILPRFAQWGLQ
jgi:hypothetical protein